jgi:predicted 2-oxoglutarate/Fe(II)-dependent dioxygenase YbiX
VLTLHEIKPLSFIYEVPRALPPDVCREMVRRFEERRDQQYAGRIGQERQESAEIKKTTDLRISGREDWQDIDKQLTRSLMAAFAQFRATFPFFAANAFKDLGYNLQRYQAGEYYHWHVDSGPGEFMTRQLVALWYLNDVAGPGGETEFPLQDIKVRPEEGKLVLFPPFWTHVHRAVTVEHGVKYIATTWVCFA